MSSHLSVLLLGAGLLLAPQFAAGQESKAASADRDAAAKALPAGFALHGVAARVSESRGVLTERDKSGVPLIAAFARDYTATGTRNSLLVIDARNGSAQQYWYPKRESSNGDVFHVMRTAGGRIYTTVGPTFLEFDLEKREWTFDSRADGMAMSFAESPDGLVYFATYPNTTLFRFDPKSRRLDRLGRLDPDEKYASSLAAAGDGWVYAGIGTARSNLVAFNTKTAERVQLADEGRRKTGSGTVMVAADGAIFGRESSGGPLVRLDGGRATPVAAKASPRRAVTGAVRWSSALTDFPGGGRIVRFNMPERYAVIELDGSARRITFDYESNGAGISSLVAGPDGKLYGSTNHPMRFFSFDPSTGALVDHGTIPQVGGGNFPAFAVSDHYIVGASYSEGAVYELDSRRPWDVKEDGTAVNPRLLGKFPEVTRPRAAVTLPNGDVLFGGYGGYGVTGGGLVTYDSASRTARAKPSSAVIPDQSPVALRLLDAKTVVGGTSIEAPGGGRVRARNGELFLWDIATQAVRFRTAPVENAHSIFALEVGAEGKVYGISNNSQFFVFDPQTKAVLHRANWREWGAPLNPGHSLLRGPNERIQVLLSKAVLEVQPDYSVRKIADLPVRTTAGGVLLGGRLYFASSSELYSMDLARNRRE